MGGQHGPPLKLLSPLNLSWLCNCVSHTLPGVMVLGEHDIGNVLSTWKVAGGVLCLPGKCQPSSPTWQPQGTETPLFQLVHGFFKDDASELRH